MVPQRLGLPSKTLLIRPSGLTGKSFPERGVRDHSKTAVVAVVAAAGAAARRTAFLSEQGEGKRGVARRVQVVGTCTVKAARDMTYG